MWNGVIVMKEMVYDDDGKPIKEELTLEEMLRLRLLRTRTVITESDGEKQQNDSGQARMTRIQ